MLWSNILEVEPVQFAFFGCIIHPTLYNPSLHGIKEFNNVPTKLRVEEVECSIVDIDMNNTWQTFHEEAKYIEYICEASGRPVNITFVCLQQNSTSMT